MDYLSNIDFLIINLICLFCILFVRFVFLLCSDTTISILSCLNTLSVSFSKKGVIFKTAFVETKFCIFFYKIETVELIWKL